MIRFSLLPFDEVTSTNDVAMTRAELEEGTIVTALCQTEGRGQRGSRWISPPGENLMFSLILEPTHLLVERQFRISEAAATAVCLAIRETSGESNCRIKWPNDLYIGDRKIGGILIEHSFHSEYLSRSVIGIGINVRQRNFDPSLPNPTSLAVEYPDRKITPEFLLDHFRQVFNRIYTDPDLHQTYLKLLWRGDGRYYSYRDDKGQFEASIEAINPDSGQLTLLDSAGEERKYWFKEVEPIL